MNKKERQRIIRQIISGNHIDCQETLLKLLFEKGVEVTQATLSRDIKELQIIKVANFEGNYVYKLSTNHLPLSNRGNELISFGFLGIEFSGNLGVVKTRPGYAMGIAAEIDHKITDEILGTVAGDDTILLIIREKVTQNEVLKALSKLTGNIIETLG